jgi:hypothetical protein
VSDADRCRQRRELGRCVDCNAKKAEPRRARCARCLRKLAEASRRWAEAHREVNLLKRDHKRWSLKLSNPAHASEENQLRYQKKVANGMCVQCPRAAENATRFCARCQKRRRIAWRKYHRKTRLAARRELREHRPIEEIVDLTRVRILRAARHLEWFATSELNEALGSVDLTVRNRVTKMLGRLTSQGRIERRETESVGGLRPSGSDYEYQITPAGIAELYAVLGGRLKPCRAGRRAA